MIGDGFEPDLITLEDEDGKNTTFEILDTLEENGEVYYALIPAEDEPGENLETDANLIVLKLEDPENPESLVTIEDDDEYERIGNIFIERLEKFFDGDDENDENEDGKDYCGDFEGDDYDGEGPDEAS